MTAFRFPLEKALDWRRSELRVAEGRLREQLAALASLDRARAQLQEDARQAGAAVRAFAPLSGEDLGALAAFRERTRQRAIELALRRAECQKQASVRQAALVEARRRTRLIERLRERRWAEWQAARDREIEALAADSYLNRFAVRRG